MRRATAWIVVVGVAAAWAAAPSRAAADAAEGFWATLAAGAAGSATPSDYTEFWFESPHAPPLAITQLTGGNAQAITAGGSTFFTSPALPVLLPTSDGYATLTNIDVPNGSGGLPRFADKAQASGAPVTGQPVPTGSSQIALSLSDAAADGSKVLSVGVTGANGNSLGQGQITVPAGGWWVIGLGPGVQDGSSDPGTGPITGGGGSNNGGQTGGGNDGGSGSNNGGSGDGGDPPPVGGGGNNNGGQTGGSGSNNGGGNPPAAAPEPATAVLLGLGGLTAASWRRLRRQ